MNHSGPGYKNVQMAVGGQRRRRRYSALKLRLAEFPGSQWTWVDILAVQSSTKAASADINRKALLLWR